ncbi:MAG: alkaline phosphatase family protein [Jatrophihabitantaceae bacterium]
MRRVVAVLAVAVAIAVSAVPFTRAAAETPRSLQHIVIMTQGGRTFDNYFGTTPGVDGLVARTPCQLGATPDQLGCIRPHRITTPPQSSLRTGPDSQQIAVNGGRMDGFVRAQAHQGSDGTAGMGYYTPAALPLLHELTGRGVLFDHWFSGVPGGTVTNDVFAITARPPGRVASIPRGGWPDTPVIFDRLTAAGISWRVYVQNYEPALNIRTAATKQRLGGQVARVPLLALPRYLDDPTLSSHVVDLSSYYRDLDADKLPQVSYVISTAATEQIPRDPAKGHLLMRSILNGLLASSAWPSSALLLQWDSAGGWYDHVPPPVIDGAPTGLRVPAVLISPFVRPGTVNHERFDAASGLKLIESTFGLAPLAARDRDAANPRGVMSFALPPVLPTLVGVSSDQPVKQPKRSTLLIGYGTALVLAVSAGVLALLLSGRGRHKPKEATS